MLANSVVSSPNVYSNPSNIHLVVYSYPLLTSSKLASLAIYLACNEDGVGLVNVGTRWLGMGVSNVIAVWRLPLPDICRVGIIYIIVGWGSVASIQNHVDRIDGFSTFFGPSLLCEFLQSSFSWDCSLLLFWFFAVDFDLLLLLLLSLFFLAIVLPCINRYCIVAMVLVVIITN